MLSWPAAWPSPSPRTPVPAGGLLRFLLPRPVSLAVAQVAEPPNRLSAASVVMGKVPDGGSQGGEGRATCSVAWAPPQDPGVSLKHMASCALCMSGCCQPAKPQPGDQQAGRPQGHPAQPLSSQPRFMNLSDGTGVVWQLRWLPPVHLAMQVLSPGCLQTHHACFYLSL